MKTVSISLEDVEYAELGKLAAARLTTVDNLLKQYVQSLAIDPATAEAAQRARARQGLVNYLRSMKTGVTVGEKPTRERTYSDRRFHRH